MYDEKKDVIFLQAILYGIFWLTILVGQWSWLRSHYILAAIVGLFTLVPFLYIVVSIGDWILSMLSEKKRRHR